MIVNVLSDGFWSDREHERERQSQAMQGFVMSNDRFWGIAETQASASVEVVWDKVRRAGHAMMSEMVLSGDDADSYRVAECAATLEGAGWDAPGVYTDPTTGSVYSVGQIIHFLADELAVVYAPTNQTTGGAEAMK